MVKSRWRDGFADFWTWVSDPANAPLLPQAPLATLPQTWETWRLKRDLANAYTLPALAAQVAADDQKETDWWPADCAEADRRLIGIQLAQIDAFAEWPSLRSYRQGPQGVILRNGTRPEEQVKGIVAAVVPTPLGTNYSPTVKALNFATTSNDALRTVGEATDAFLTRGVLWLIFIFLLTGTFWFVPLWLAVTALILRQGWFIVALVAFLGIPLVTVCFFPQPARKWAATLRRSAVYLSIDGERGQSIDGESFGVPACLAILVALAEMFPPRGALRRLIHVLMERSLLRAYTGVVTPRGKVTAVDPETVCQKIDVMDKARVAYGHLPHANGPFQQSWLGGVRSLTNLARQLLRLPNWQMSVNVACFLLFLGGAWFLPPDATITGGQTENGRFRLQGDIFEADIPRDPGKVYVKVSRSWRPLTLKVVVEGGSAELEQGNVWAHEQTVPVESDGKAVFWVSFAEQEAIDGWVTLLLVDHRRRICDSRVLHLLVGKKPDGD